MNVKHIGNIETGQDGALWKDYLFRLDAAGVCHAYHVSKWGDKNHISVDVIKIDRFLLDKSEYLKPHSNSVAFGTEYYCPDDEFPLLYTNIYNNYANESNRMKGVCCVYRLKRSGTTFSTALVQIIEIGFTEDTNYWRSDREIDDVRPYGNFVVDRERKLLWAFTMRDKTNTTRYFSFDVPKLTDGVRDSKLSVNRVVLNACDIKQHFDSEYQHFLQGVCIHDGKIYSLEGFDNDPKNPPAIRIIDTVARNQMKYVDLTILGTNVEPEMIDFSDGVFYYGDNAGNLYIMQF